jgi:peptidoglycan/LPS O-acetylase OafA/YrhL
MQAFGYNVIACLAAMLVYYAASARPRWLGLPPLTTFGRYSYGLYLWHAPVILGLVRLTSLSGFVFVLAAMTGTTVLTALSWKLVEQPALGLRNRRSTLDEKAIQSPIETVPTQ